MPAPQQSQSPIYKATSNIPRPEIDRFLHDPRDSAGYRLARALDVGIQKVGKKFQENKAERENYEDQVNTAHAQLGLAEFNSDQAKGGINLHSGDFEINKFEAKKGNLAGTSAGADLRQLYQEGEVYKLTDPEKFQAWVRENMAEGLADAKSKGQSYYAGYVKALGASVEGLSKEFTGAVQSALANDSVVLA